MFETSRSAALVLVATLGLAGPAFGQRDDPAAEFEGETTVTEVLLDVRVTDSRDVTILGLGAEDFRVLEDGEQVGLTSVTFYSNRLLQGATPALDEGRQPDVEVVDRYFVLFIHDQRQGLTALTGQQLDAGRYLKTWAQTELLPNDFVAVVSYNASLKIHQDFTSDREAIVRAIGKGVISKGDSANWPSRHPDSLLSLARNLPSGRELRKQTTNIQHALRLVAEALGDLRGRKSLLFFSVGFGEVREFGVWTPDPRYYPPMMEALNTNNVAVYAIDWVPSAEGGSAFGRGLNDSLSLLAKDTGGEYFLHFNSFSTPLSEITRENNGYYLLSYQSRHPLGEAGFQEVRVETVNPEFEVRTRRGYRYGGPPRPDAP